jgi:hypothetical protein
MLLKISNLTPVQFQALATFIASKDNFWKPDEVGYTTVRFARIIKAEDSGNEHCRYSQQPNSVNVQLDITESSRYGKTHYPEDFPPKPVPRSFLSALLDSIGSFPTS